MSSVNIDIFKQYVLLHNQNFKHAHYDFKYMLTHRDVFSYDDIKKTHTIMEQYRRIKYNAEKLTLECHRLSMRRSVYLLMLSDTDEDFNNMINHWSEDIILSPSMEFDDEDHVLIHSIIYAECKQRRICRHRAEARFEYVYQHYHALVVETADCARPCLYTQTCMQHEQWKQRAEKLRSGIFYISQPNQYISKYMDIIDLTTVHDII